MSIASRRGFLRSIAAMAGAAAAGPLSAMAAPAKKPNILFISVDDWNDWVGCLGDEQAITPNLDRLAKRGVLFTNAHCAAPVCNPSRVAVMTGLRPWTTGVYENSVVFRKNNPDLVTIPQHFSANGYKSHGGGKIFHDNPAMFDHASWDDYFQWHPDPFNSKKGKWPTASTYSHEPDPEPEGRPGRKITKPTKRNFDWAALDRPETDWPDRKVADWAAGFLSKEQDKPFFLAVGMFRPHVPWYNPRKYVEMYRKDDLRMPPVKDDDLDDLGEWARERAKDKNSKHDKLVEFGEWRGAVQAYRASISFSDANVGRVLDALDAGPHRDNTIIVLWSDHGYHLGEKFHWHKRTLWERATRVPMIFVAPGVAEAGSRCDQPANLIDIYPTLNELAGLPARPELEGESLVPLLREPASKAPRPSLTTLRPGNHAVRDERWRYIRYTTGEEELYDLRSDPNEWTNLAGDSRFAVEKKRLREWLERLTAGETAQGQEPTRP